MKNHLADPPAIVRLKKLAAIDSTEFEQFEEELEQKTQGLQRQLDWFKRQMFGQKSEKILPGPDEVPCLPGFEGSPKEAPQGKGMATV